MPIAQSENVILGHLKMGEHKANYRALISNSIASLIFIMNYRKKQQNNAIQNRFHFFAIEKVLCYIRPLPMIFLTIGTGRTGHTGRTGRTGRMYVYVKW